MKVVHEIDEATMQRLSDCYDMLQVLVSERTKRYFTVQEAADYICMSPDFVSRTLVRRIPYHQERAGAIITFDRADLDAYKQSIKRNKRVVAVRRINSLQVTGGKSAAV